MQGTGGMPDRRHGDDVRGDLVAEVADALTQNQAVQWERCARLAAPSDRGALDNLRAIAPAVLGRDAPGDAPPAGPGSSWSALARRGTRVLGAIAALEVASALLLLPWFWGDYHREHGDVALFFTNHLVGFGATAFLLLVAGRREPRAQLLGLYCLLSATNASQLMLPAFLLDMPPPEMFAVFLRELPARMQVFFLLHVPSYLFAPAVLWAFARECPRICRRTRLDDFARRMVPVSVGIGFALWIACAAVIALSQAGVAGAPVSFALDASVLVQNLLALAAAAVVAARARTAPADEVRRIVIFSVGFLMHTGVAVAYNGAEVFRPGDWVSNFDRSPLIVGRELLRFPGLLLLWYSALAVRVFHPREVAQACRRVLVRPGLLEATGIAAAVALGLLVAGDPGRAVGAVITDPLALALFATAGVLVLAALGRGPILRRLNVWAYPETLDQRHVLAAATARLVRAEEAGAVHRTVVRAVRRGCGSAAALVAATGPGRHDEAFRAPEARIGPLPRRSAIVHMLESAGGTLRVHPGDASSFFQLLPEPEAAWVTEADADAIAPVPGPGGQLAGVLLVGPRFDGRPVRAADLPFLEALGAAAGLALGRLWAARPPGTPAPEAPPARECPVCRLLAAPGEAPGCGCGSAYVETDVPALLGGKFRLIRCLGAGGMGAVYLARDVRLQRSVAVKALAGTSASGLKALGLEAWVMAGVAHPGVAGIHGIESWRGRPFLLIEYLAGGTLADRLRSGPVPEGEAVHTAAMVADALAAFHDTGCLHGDVKPSNIGFTAGGSPKLLDFGLARGAGSAAAGGTLRYASPEILSGRPAGEADDVWSLCVVLYEMVSGEHPFDGGSADEVARRIRRRRIARPGAAAGEGPPTPVIAFAAATLRGARSARPATARAFAAALRSAAADGA